MQSITDQVIGSSQKVSQELGSGQPCRYSKLPKNLCQTKVVACHSQHLWSELFWPSALGFFSLRCGSALAPSLLSWKRWRASKLKLGISNRSGSTLLAVSISTSLR